MKILILGGHGNLGTQLTEIFSLDQEVTSWDREDLDVLDFKLLRENILALQPELIINTVAYNAVDNCENEEGRVLARKLNVDLPRELAEITLELKAVIIQYSTDYVFNGLEDKPSFSENDTPNPINRYGESKFGGEQEILKREAPGLKYYLIRTSKLFGPRGSSPAAKPSFFDIMLSLAQTKKELTVVNEELSCFTYTRDLAEATRRLWESDAPYGIYHLFNEGPCTWYEAVSELFRLKDIAVPVRAIRSENLLRAARRPKFSVLVNTKVKKLRNWKIALKDYLENQ